MDFEQIIGTHAGIVWRTLHDAHEGLSFESLMASTNLRVEDIAAAIGWLSREHKIYIEDTDNGIVYFVYKECYY